MIEKIQRDLTVSVPVATVDLVNRRDVYWTDRIFEETVTFRLSPAVLSPAVPL